jgi:nucleoside-diphosphate-sugar epimerase
MLGDMTTAARRVCVTGATGKAGRAAVRELREHGYDVIATDAVVGRGRAPRQHPGAPHGHPGGHVQRFDRARDLLGYEPAHSWRDYVK